MYETVQREIEHERPVEFKLEDLGSVGILRVLETVTKQGSINIGLLGRKTGMNDTSVDRHVRKLAELGLLEEKRCGAIRMIKPKFDSLAVVFKKGLGVRIVKS